MVQRRLRNVLLGISGALLWLFLREFDPDLEIDKENQPNYEHDDSLVEELSRGPQTYSSEQTCKFPILDPFDASIMKYVKHPARHECAFIQPTLTFVRLNSVYINRTLAQLWRAWEFQARSYFRPPGSDKAIIYGDWTKWAEPEAGLPIRKHGLEVQALYKLQVNGVPDGKEEDEMNKRRSNVKRRYYNIHPNVLPPREDDPKLAKAWPTQPERRPLNVLIFGIDSVSRSNVVRNLPLTYKVLTERIGGYVMNGYSKIDDNTFPNMMAVLTGHRVTIHGSELAGGGQKTFVDDWPMIWKNFSAKGYTTLLSEEQPGIFSYKAKGFSSAPTDIYLRPYGAIMASLSLYTKHLCFGNEAEAKLFMDVLHRFAQVHQQRPHFTFSFLWKWSHDHANSIQMIDHLIADWLTGLLEGGLLANTVLMVMGDHGNRFDEIRQTLVGRYEERMPFLFVHTPRHLRQRHPQLHRALKLNTWRLTCQYDVFETLVDILNEDYSGRARPTLFDRGTSLFTEIAKNRTCADVGIPEHFCVCQTEQTLDTKLEVVQRAAETVVEKINDLISQYTDICHSVKLDTVLGASHFEPTKQVLKNNRYVWNDFVSEANVTGVHSHIRVTLRTQPNSAVYEALVRCEIAEQFAMVIGSGEKEDLADCQLSTTQGDVSRINAYGRTADCISYRERSLEPFCTCR